VRCIRSRRVAGPGWRHRVTTTVLTVLAIAFGLVAVATPANAAVHVDNPFANARGYVNPDWATLVNQEAARTGGTLGQKMSTVATYPTAVWMDRIAAITEGRGLRGHLNAALAQSNGTPVVITIVIYDLPNRDCAALASNGELLISQNGLARYRTEYIDPIAAILADPAYDSLRIVTIVEPDSLPNLITNLNEPKCAEANSTGAYEQGIQYALNRLHAISNVYTYLDIAHSGWLGWDSNFGPFADLTARVVRGTTAGLSSLDGFVSNTANYTPAEEPFLTDSNRQVGGQPVKSAAFYEWNPYFDEIDFAANMRSAMISRGFPASIGMLVDTSRNGWGGPNRPTSVSTSTDLNTYVNESRVDRRPHRGGWCNQAGAGIGARPAATPAAGFDAWVWIKPPGESDGVSQGGITDPNDPNKKFDPMCDPNARNRYNSAYPTNALPNAPHAGRWFPEQFRMLVENAYPAIGSPPPTDTTPPTAPSNLASTGKTDTTVSLSWTASTDNIGVTAYDVFVGSILAKTVTGSPPATSTTVTGLTASTTYTFTVKARDAAGNASATSNAVTVTTNSGPPSDTTPPTAPSGLTSTGKTDSSVSLSWTASTDNVGVTAYDVYAGSTLVKTVTGSPPATSTTVTGLTASTAYTFTVKARDAAGNTSAASNAVTVTTNAPPPGGGSVKGQYRNFDSSATDNQIKPGLAVINTGTANLDLSTVKIRYWFTGDAGATTYSTWCDYALRGCGNLTHRVVAITPKTGADRYLEIGFTSGAGTLAPGASTGDAQLRLNKTDWSAFTESNDYSWSGTQTGYGDWTKITVYVNGTLAWGTEP